MVLSTTFPTVRRSNPRIVHDVNIGIMRVDLVITVPRYHCKDCGAAFRHIFTSVPEGKHSTFRLLEQLRRDVFTRPFSQVATEYGFTEGTIRYVFDEYAEQLEAKRGPIVAPEVLGIDEKHIVHAMRGIFVDIKTGRLLEMTENNKEADIVGTIERMVDYDKNIRIVTTDMANNYRSHIQLCLPECEVDRGQVSCLSGSLLQGSQVKKESDHGENRSANCSGGKSC